MNKSAIFFDFDGVIKESLEVKSDAFAELFDGGGETLKSMVKDHHLNNPGLNRNFKIALYLPWAGIDVNDEVLSDYCEKFSKLVVSKVIESDWVGGVCEFIKRISSNTPVFLLSATPQKELDYIVEQLKLTHVFREIIGWPDTKVKALEILIDKYQIDVSNAVMFGDSETDYYAANNNNVSFILRQTPYNRELCKTVDCRVIKDFRDNLLKVL